MPNKTEVIEKELREFCSLVLNRELTQSESALVKFDSHQVDEEVYAPLRTALLSTAPCADKKVVSNPLLLATFASEFNNCLSAI